MLPDPAKVLALIKTVATAEILPRFRRLAAAEVRAKRSPHDLVTIADEAAEARLSAGLVALLPGSVVIGEEAAEGDPGLIARLAGPAPAWLVDPVDGTNNFVAGNPAYAVVVALCLAGEIEAGWIYQPETGAAVQAALGKGAWLIDPAAGERRLRLSPPAGINEMCGSLARGAARALQARAAREPWLAPRSIVRLGSTGCEYLELARGGIDFAYYVRLKPWDHAAGVLIHREAGGVSGLRGGGGQTYRPGPVIAEDALLLAPDAPTWRMLDAALG